MKDQANEIPTATLLFRWEKEGTVQVQNPKYIDIYIGISRINFTREQQYIHVPVNPKMFYKN